MQHGDMEEKKMMWHKHREYKAIRTLTAVIVLIFVFWCGYQFGQIRASLGMEHNFGYRMVQGGFGSGVIEYSSGGPAQLIPPTTGVMNVKTVTGSASASGQ